MHAQVLELVDQSTYELHCTGHTDLSPGLERAHPKQLCLIAFLPPLADTKAVGRNRYIQVG